ncbi:MAG: methyltransferase domain-containing protein [Candidatus Hodarchaeota archaeon]
MKKLNLGCGNDIKKGWINLDVYSGPGIDIVHNLNDLPLPFSDEEFELILCTDVLEHVNYFPLMNELHRILKKKGAIKIKVPHFSSKTNYGDPTHKHQFSFATFDYFVRESKYAYKRDVKLFSTIKVRIIFEKFNNIFLRTFYTFLEKWVNKSKRNQNFYEISFLRMFPAWYIDIVLIK